MIFFYQEQTPALLRLFFTSVTTLGREKIGAQKIKKQIFSKISSIL